MTAGSYILQWLRAPGNLAALKENLSKNILYNPTSEQLKILQQKIDAEEERLKGTDRQHRVLMGNAVDRIVPSLSRNTSYEILDIIAKAEEPVPVQLQADFVFDYLFCEWAYVLDLDEDVLEVYAGSVETSTPGRSTRFDFLRSEDDATPPDLSPRLIESCNLSALPESLSYEALDETYVEADEEVSDDESSNEDAQEPSKETAEQSSNGMAQLTFKDQGDEQSKDAAQQLPQGNAQDPTNEDDKTQQPSNDKSEDPSPADIPQSSNEKTVGTFYVQGQPRLTSS
jgi:hypothetical protein